jgi:hypothetical protein
MRAVCSAKAGLGESCTSAYDSTFESIINPPAFRTSICQTLFLIEHCYYHHNKLTKIGERIRQIESMPQHFQALHSPTAAQRHCSHFQTHAGITDSATDDNMIVCSRERISKIFLLHLAQLLTKALLQRLSMKIRPKTRS